MDGHCHSHHHNIGAISFTFTEAFDTKALAHRLNVFLLFQAQGVYRAKGVFYDPQEDTKMIIQSVGTRPLLTRGRRWKPAEEKLSRMVFIGRHLKPAGFEKMIRQFARKTVT
jgi:G3E family GTPase